MAAQQPGIAAQGKQSDQGLEDRDEYKGRLIEFCMPCVEYNLNIDHLICLINIKEVNQIASCLQDYQSRGMRKEATEGLLKAIKDSEKPGKWQMLIDAFERLGDTVVLHHLKGQDFDDPWLDKPEHRELIRIFQEPLQYLNIRSLLDVMFEKDLFLEQDKKKLEDMLQRRECLAAQRYLIIAMQAHNKDWYRIFLTTMYEDDHCRQLAMLIDEEFCQKELVSGKEKEADPLMENSADPLDQAHLDLQSSATNRSREEPGSGEHSTNPPLLEQNTGVRTFPQTEELFRAEDEQRPIASELGEATCACRCCAKLQAEVAALTSISKSLQTELVEIKTLLQSFLASNKHQP